MSLDKDLDYLSEISMTFAKGVHFMLAFFVLCIEIIVWSLANSREDCLREVMPQRYTLPLILFLFLHTHTHKDSA